MLLLLPLVVSIAKGQVDVDVVTEVEGEPSQELAASPYKTPLFRCTSAPSILLPSSARCDRYPDCPTGEDELGCDQWFRHDWSTDTNFLPAAIPKDPSVGIAWGNNFANAWSPDDSTSDVWNPQSPLNRNPWSPDAPYSDPSPEVGQNWAYSPDGGNVTEGAGPLLPAGSPILESPMSGAAIQYPAQMPLAELPQECLFPPPSCPVPWVRPSQRWYFDPSSGTCSQFQYSCGEGVNNFHTRSLCSSYCQESTRRPFIPNYPPQTTQLQIPTLTASTLPQYIRSNKNTLVEFYTEWCSACRIFGPKFQTIASTLRQQGVASARVDIDQDRELALQYGVTSFPRVLFWNRNLPDCPRRYHYEDGMEVGNIISWVGNQMEEAHRLEPAPPVFTPRPPYQPRPNHNPPPPIPNDTPSTTTSTEKPDERTCNRQCSRIFSQVCGSNGRTYNNRCLLELDACERATSIQVLREGSCLSTTTEESQPTTTDPYPQLPQNPTTPENTFGIVVCRRTEFTCSLDQKCISYIQRCDGKQDCSDGQDEKLCEGDCTLTEFRCNDGACIDFSQRCDTKFDCPDLTDELDCPRLCSKDEFTCNDGSCCDAAFRCDGKPDCQDVTDEIGCPNQNATFPPTPSTSTPTTTIAVVPTTEADLPPGRGNGQQIMCNSATEFTCKDLRLCVKLEVLCDGFPDCTDVSDENNCPAEDHCDNEYLFRCPDGECLDSRRRCDGYDDCRDGGDEINCWDVECQYWQLKCQDTGVCVHRAYECDGRNECDDGSDERNCTGGDSPLLESVQSTVIVPDQPPSTENYDFLEETTTEEKLEEAGGSFLDSGFWPWGGESEEEKPTPTEATRDCSFACTREYNPVCGSNGEMYSNPCLLQMDACTTGQEITVLYENSTNGRADVSIYGRICDRSSLPCPESCPDLRMPVCASNKKTYDNACLVELEACHHNSSLFVAYEGDCRMAFLCEDGLTWLEGEQVCDGKPDCPGGRGEDEEEDCLGEQPPQCRDACPQVHAPVCGDDGYTYRSLCLLEQTACQQGKNITAVYAGQCRSQANSTAWEEGQALYDDYTEDDQILCPTKCEKIYDPVCGMDNQTYSNECFLRKAECSNMMVIQVRHIGPCILGAVGPDKDRIPTECDVVCSSVYKPVCGSDGITYDNECMLRTQACREQSLVSVNYEGVCSNCHPQLDWRCSDTTCINNTQVCDGREDCSDGGDEQFCNFICYDMQTIDMEKVCDQVPDCPEGEDEDNCQVKAEEMIVNYDGQESGDYEEEDNGGTFGSWDLW